MSDPIQNEFDHKLQRSRTRESSTLTIATVASSASLLLLGLYLQVLCDEQCKNNVGLRQMIIFTGILFALLGIAYRDVTAFTIHRDDECYLRIKMRYCNKKKANLNEIRDGGNSHIVRAGSLHFLLIIPLWAWGVVLLYSSGSITIETIAITIGIIVTSAAYISIISGVEAEDPCLSWRTAFKKVLRCNNDTNTSLFKHITKSGIVNGVGLQDRDIIQIDATVIAGALVLLSLTTLGRSDADPFISKMILVVTISILVPFAASAIAAIGKWRASATEESIKIARFAMVAGFWYLIVGLIILFIIVYTQSPQTPTPQK
ncbi:MAG: hypothetical protein HMLIMOIP_001813 [Candidatus Nitrosomirales archaeon]